MTTASSLHLRLKDYYAKAATHGASEGADDGIISLSWRLQSDFSKNLSEVVAEDIGSSSSLALAD